MIQKAAKAQPDDGYITDSLGWVYYRLGRYQDAVAPMLRAVELTPDDPIINDHLGDVLWMVGRKREAEFQWRRALSFGPADDLDMDRIRKKLDVGLDTGAGETAAKGRLSGCSPRARAAGRARPRQGQPRAPRHRPPRRRLSPARQPRRLPRVGDRLEAEPAAGLSLAIDGPFARDLGAGADNLVLRAALAPARAADPGAALRLIKSLPVASGIGGGSADAAATLRLLSRLWDLPLPPAPLLAALGADVPVCARRPRLPDARHRRGARRRSPCRPSGSSSSNPGVPVPTAGGLRRPSPAATTRRCPSRRPSPTPTALADWLAGQRNDLEAPAAALAPPIGAVLAALAAQPGCRLARMSGSGATCFGFFTAEPAGPRRRRGPPPRPSAWWTVAAARSSPSRASARAPPRPRRARRPRRSPPAPVSFFQNGARRLQVVHQELRRLEGRLRGAREAVATIMIRSPGASRP